MSIKNKLVVFTSPVTWSQLRVLYESGEYPNLKTLHEKQHKNYSDMPDVYALSNRATKECWDKDRYTEVKTELKRRNMVELYASLGMDDREQARYRIECIKAVDKLRDNLNQLYDILADLDPGSKQHTETLGKIKVLSDTMIKGLNTSLAALQDISKLTGDYAPVATKEVKGHTYKAGSTTGAVEDMTEEEIVQDLKRMQAAGIDLNDIGALETSPDEQGGVCEP